MLEVTLPKAEVAKPKQIAVTVGDRPADHGRGHRQRAQVG